MSLQNEPQAVRAEIRRLKVKQQNTLDPDIRAALALKIEQLQATLPPDPVVDPPADPVPVTEPTPATQPAPEEAPVEEPAPPAATPEQLAQADNLVRQARVEKMRGNRQRSTELLQQAAAAAPGAPALLEALGDDLMDRRQIKDARDAYAKALKLDPKNVGLERKYAELVLRLSGMGSIEDQLRMNLSDSPLLSPGETLASARSATLLSFFVPGAGQFVLGQNTKGAFILGGWLLMVFWIFLLREDLKGLLAMVGIPSASGPSRPGSLLVMVPIFAAAALHLASLFMCASLAKAANPARRANHPVPPVDKPF